MLRFLQLEHAVTCYMVDPVAKSVSPVTMRLANPIVVHENATWHLIAENNELMSMLHIDNIDDIVRVHLLNDPATGEFLDCFVGCRQSGAGVMLHGKANFGRIIVYKGGQVHSPMSDEFIMYNTSPDLESFVNDLEWLTEVSAGLQLFYQGYA